MMTIPQIVESTLSEDVWKRKSMDGIEQAFHALKINPSCDFAEFYRRYWGPFHSGNVGHELLDVVEQDESIMSATQAARDELGLPDHYAVVSTLDGLSVLVYDTDTEQVFDVDFEGGAELLQRGELQPRWQSWNEFVTDYFAPAGCR